MLKQGLGGFQPASGSARISGCPRKLSPARPPRSRFGFRAALLAVPLLALMQPSAAQTSTDVSVSIDSPRVSEGASGTTTNLTFTISLSAASDQLIVIGYKVDSADPGTATPGRDYERVSSGSWRFAAGQTSKRLQIRVKGDGQDEPDETIKVKLLALSANVRLESATGTGTIVDDDSAPVVSLSLNPTAIHESDQSDGVFDSSVSTVTASLNRATSATVTVTVSAAAGTGATASDFSLSANRTLTIAAGQTASRGLVTVSAVDNDADDADKQVSVSGKVSGGMAGSAPADPAAMTLTILDDDGEPTLSIDSPSVAEGDSGSKHLTFTVSLSPTSDSAVTVEYADAGTGTATAGTDYAAVPSGTLTFAAGATYRTVMVRVTGDALDEPDETVKLTLSGATNAELGTATGTGTIKDDDDTPTVTLTLANSSISENGGTTTVSAALSHASATATTVTVTGVPGFYTAGSDATIAIAAGQTSNAADTATINAVDNARDEPDRTVTVTASAQNSHQVGAVSGATLTLEDDDDPPTVGIDSPSVLEGDSGTANLAFTVSLSAASGHRVTVKYADAGTGTATAGTDYTAVSAGTLTFAAGETSKTIAVSVAGDTLDEADETVRVTLSEPSNAALDSSKTTGVGTITDDDVPILSIDSPSVSEGDSGEVDLDFTVSLSAAGRRAVTVGYAVDGTDGGTAEAGTDYAALATGTATIAAGSRSTTVTVKVKGDVTDEPDETVKLTLSSPSNATLDAAKTTGTGTITDDDDPPTVKIDSPSAAEGDSGQADLTFTVSLSAASGKQVTVNYAVDGTDAGTAASGTDYAALASGTLTFDAGETSQTITVKVNGDTQDEPNETVRVTLSGPGNATLGTATGVGTITDDDDPPSLSIDSPSAAESENLTFTVSLSAASGKQVTVDYALDGTPGTATSGTDYATLPASPTLTFNAGETTKTITVQVTDDALDEANETVRVTLSSPGNAALGTATGVGTITDDDDPPSLSIDSPSAAESENLTFTVSLSAASGKQVTVDYALDGTPGTATSGTDYAALPASPTLTFNAGETTKTITVQVTDDALDEANETVRVTLSSPGNAALGTATGVGTITDDDDPPSLSIDSPSAAESENLTFTVSLSAASGKQVTVNYALATDAGTATSGRDHMVLAAGTLTFATGTTTQTITVTVTDDALDEADETVRVTLNNPTNATLDATKTTGVGTITDNDGEPSLSIDSPSQAESTNLEFTVTLSAASGKQVTVNYALATDAGTATSGTDYAALPASGTLTFTAGQTTKTITVTVTDDALDEANETVRVTLSTPTNASIGTATGVGTITDDDGEPSLSIGNTSATEGDSGSTSLTFTVTLLPASGQTVTVGYAVVSADAGTATAGTDYAALAAGTLTFAANETSKTITVSVTGDTQDEPNETVKLTLSGATNASIGTAVGTGTITDDDDAPTVTLSLDDASIAENGGTAAVSAALSNASSAATTVTVSAVAGLYTVPGSADTITIAAGATTSTGRVTITAVDNNRDEADRSGTVGGTATNSQAAGGTLSVTGAPLTLEDDDDAPTVGIDSPTVAEGDSGQTDLTFTVSLSAASNRQVTANYALDGADGGTASSGDDYAALAAGTLTFEAGETSQTITVQVNGDTQDEPNETVRVTLSAPAQATLDAAKTTGAGTITDDDDAPTVTLSLDDVSIAENGGTAEVTATLSGGTTSSAATTVTIAAVSGLYTVEADAEIVIAAGATTDAETVTITAVDNAQDEANRGGTVGGTAANSQATGGALSVTGASLTLEDDDGQPTLSIDSPSAAEEDSGQTDLTFAVSLSAASGRTVTVNYAVASPDGGTASSGDDYDALAGGTLTFDPGDRSKTVVVKVNGDTMDEPDETVKLTLSGPSNASLGAVTGTGTITDDDDAPTVTLSLDDSSISENGGTAEVTATLSGGTTSSAATTVTVAAVSGLYTVESDAEIVIAAGSSTDAETVTITAVDNALDEADRGGTVTATAANSQAAGGALSVSGAALTLEDDDGQPTLSIDSPSVAEGDSGQVDLTFMVSLSAASGRTVTVAYAVDGTDGGTASSGGDYDALAGGTLTFDPGDRSKTIVVKVNGDTQDEPNETVKLRLSGAAQATMGTATGTGTIQDDDDAPTVTLSLDDDSISENGGTAEVSATLSHGSSAATTVTVSAVAGLYTVPGLANTITIAAGDTTSTGRVTITAVDNAQDEANRGGTVGGTAANSQATGGALSVTGASLTLEDDDGQPTLSIDSPSAAEGDSGQADLTFAVSLSAASGRTVTVNYAVASPDGGTASSGDDYDALASGTLTFDPGDRSKTVVVKVNGDTQDEPNETVKLTLSGPSNASLGAATGTGTITDDDDAPTVTLSLDDASISENGGTAEVTATLSGGTTSSAATTVTVAAVSGLYTVEADAEIVIAAGSSTDGETVTITAVDNSRDEANRGGTVTGTAANSQAAGGGLSVTGASLTLEDDDDAPTVGINSPSAAEGDSGQADLTFTVSLSAASNRQVTASYALDGTDGGTAASGDDYVALAAGTLTFEAGETSQTITVQVNGDTQDEPNETVRVTLSGPSNASLGTATGTGTITDDDDAPTVTLSLDDASISENGGTAEVTATLSGGTTSSAATTVTVAAVSGLYTVESDAEIVIAAGSSTDAETVTITAVDNALDEADRGGTVTATAANSQAAGGALSVSGAALTLEDDDGQPTLSIDSPSVAEGDSGQADLTFTVSLSAASGRTVTVAYAVDGTDGGTASSGDDYDALAGGTLTFDPGDRSKTMVVKVNGDTQDEPNETVKVRLSGASQAALGTAVGTGTITDDDDAPTVTLSLDDASISENGGTAEVTATLSGGTTSSATTTVTVAAVAGLYTVEADAEIVIAAGSSTDGETVTITAVDNAQDEANRGGTVGGTAANSQAAGGALSVTGAALTLEDDDGQPSLSIDSPSATEGDSGQADLTFAVSLSAASGRTVTVNYAVASPDGGTASSGDDYDALASGTLTFDPGDRSKTVVVKVNGDTQDEPDETVKVRLSGASQATLGTAVGTGTITDDDDAPTVTLSLDDASISENGGTAEVTATLSGGTTSSAATTVTVAAVSGLYTVEADAEIVIAAGSSTDGETVTITAVDNALDEADRGGTVTATAANSQAAGGALSVTGAALTLEDDDGQPSLSIDSPSATEGDSGQTDLTFAVSLSAASGRTVTVGYAVDGSDPGTAAAGTDYATVTAGTLTFNPGDRNQTVVVKVNGDTQDEPDETVKVRLSGASQATLGTATGTGTITDDDDAPTVTLSLDDDSISESGGTAEVSATLSHGSSAATTVTVSAVAGLYTVPGSANTITIAAGDTTSTGRVTITAVDNAQDEANRGGTVGGTAANSQATGGALSVAGASLTLEDDDGQPSLSIDSPSAAESTSLEFTVTLSPASGRAVTVDYALDGTPGTAVSGTDYTALPASPSLTFNAGETTKTITVTVTDDALDEADETVRVTLSNANNASIGTATGEGTIQDNDALPSLSISSPTAAESANLEFTVTLSPASGQTVTVGYAVDSTDAGTATAGTDYAALTPGTLTFAAGTTSQTITVSVTGDALDEANETVRVTLSGATNAGIGTATGTGTITDDDGAPSLSIAGASVTEGDSGSASLTFTVTLSPASGQTVTVGYAVAATDAGTATAGTDYAAVMPGTLTFAAGTMSQTITVSVTGDTQDEPNETVKVTLSGAANAGIGTAVGTGTITDDDDAPTVTLSLDDASIAENGGTAAVSAALSHASSAATTVTITAVSGLYTVEADAEIVIAAGAATDAETVTITAVDNSRDEANRGGTVIGTAANSQAAGGSLSVTGASLTLENDDGAPTLSIDSPSAAESENLTFTVTLSAASGRRVTVNYALATDAGTATSGTDYAALPAPGTLTFTAGQTTKAITVTVTDDALDEADETVRVTLSNAGNASIGTATGVGTITDDDAAPSLSINSPSRAESANLEFTVTLSAASGQQVTVDYALATDAGTAISGTDYTALPASPTLTFAVGQTTKTITVTVTDDALDEADETVRVTLSNASNATLDATKTTGVGTITDNDDPPALSIDSPSAAESENLTFTVRLSAASGRQVTVGYAVDATDPGTAASGTDYTAPAAGTLTFNAGTMSQMITVTVTDDALDEANETVRMTLSNAGNAGIGTATGVGTITDNDGQPSLAINSPNAAEGDSGSASLTFTVTLMPASGQTVTVGYAVVSTDAGTATAGTDYAALAPGTLTFNAGTTSQTIAVSVTGDTQDEPDETVKVTLSGAANAGIGTAVGTGTITNDDDAPTVTLSLDDASISENGGTAAVSAALSNASSAATTVTIAAVNGLYTVEPDAEIVIAAGATTDAETVTITAVDNSRDEANRGGTVTGTAANSRATGGMLPVTGAPLTLEDDDGQPTLSIDSPNAPEGDSGQTALTFTASLSAASNRQVTANYALDGTDGGTASSGDDYDALAAGTLTFAAGETSQTITVQVNGDTRHESDETVRVTLSGAMHATLGTATGVGTITDDDAPRAVGGRAEGQSPTVNAGADAAVSEGSEVVLDGSASFDPEGGALTYRWTQVGAWLTSAAPADLSRERDRAAARIPERLRMSLNGADTARPRFTARPQPELLEACVLVFRLTVTDSDGQSNGPAGPGLGLNSAQDPGLVTITVRPGPDDPPVAVARASEAGAGGGLERSLAAGKGERVRPNGAPEKPLVVGEGARVRLDGAGSWDPEGEALSYAWTQTGPRGAGGALAEAAAMTLSHAAAERPTFTAPVQLAADLALQFALAVNERGHRDQPATDAVTVTVRAGPNDAPTAVARAVGEDGELVAALEVGEGETVTLDGSGSSDPEREALSYAWTQRSGPAADDLKGADTARPTFAAPRRAQDAAVVFGLVVTDARGLRSAEDTVSILVRAHTGKRLTRVTEVLLPEAMRTVADMQASAVGRRLERAGQAGAPRNPGLLELLELRGPAAVGETAEWKSLLPEAFFAMPLGASDGGGRDGGLTLWGSGDYRSLDGDRKGVRWNGEAASGHLGADRLLSNGMRAGLSVSWSEAEFDYMDAGDGMGGDWKLRLTGVQPYLGWSADVGLDLWASLGYGRGDLDIQDQALAGEAQQADVDTRMAAVGASGRLYEAAGLRLSMRGEALYSRFRIGGNGGLIAGQIADSTRLRLALDGEGETALTSGARLSPRFELGLRHDGGDGSRGLGVELGGGVEYAADGLRLSAGARALVGNDSYDEWGVNLTGLYTPADDRGLSFRMLPSWGEAQSDAEQLWERGAPNLDGEAQAPDPKARLETELGYGLASPFGRGLLKLTAGSTLIEDRGANYRLAGMVDLAGASWGLEFEARHPEIGAAERRAMVRGDLRF